MTLQPRWALPLILTCGACSTADSAPVAVRTDSAGIEIVRSSGSDLPLRWRIEPAVSIASDDDGGAGVFDPNEALIRSDRQGRLYVLDFAGTRVIVFGPDGRFLHALGRKGSGPGEFNFPLAYTVAEDGTTSVFDVSKRRLVRFAADGSVLEEEQLGPGFSGGQLHSTPNELLYDYRGQEGGRSMSGIYRSSANGGGVLVQSPDPPMKPFNLQQQCGISISGMPALLAPYYRWTAQGPRILVAREATYDLMVFENGREVRRIRRDVEPRPTTEELAKLEVGDGMRVRFEGGVRVCPPDLVVKERGFAPVIPATGRMAIAPNGEIWVRRGGVKGEQLPIDIFAADGAYLGTLPRETPFPAAFISDTRFAAVSKDDNDLGKIGIYDIKH
jgi:hypothetical protein